MPQLEQLHSRCAAVSAQTHMKAGAPAVQPPATAQAPLPLAPPVPRAVLFNSVIGTAYQVLTSAFARAPLTSVSIFTVQRLQLAHRHFFSSHVAAATRCRLPFCISERGVTWNDVVTTLLLPLAATAPTSLQWNVQVLGQDAVTGLWRPITPSLSSRLETRYFLCTDVEVLFRHYHTSTLYMQAVPLTSETTSPDWLTPLQRSTSLGTTPPPPPVKPPRTVTAPPQSGRPPCRLAADLDSAARPAMWSLAAFVQQQRRWGCRCSVLRDRTAGLTPREALRLVQEELRRCCTASTGGCAVAADGADAGAATWALSLLEYECAVLGDDVHDVCAALTAGQSLPFRLCWKRLRRAAQLACKVVQVVDSVLSSAGEAERAGFIEPDFPRDWLALLLSSLRLRGLRHLALAHATGATVCANKPPWLRGETPVWAMDVLVGEAVQTADWVVESLCSLCERNDVPGLPQAALLEPLLACAVSLAELAAYLSTNTSHRCAIMEAAVMVCRHRARLAGGGGDDGGGAGWLPRCISDVVARMQSKLDGVPPSSSAFVDYAALLRLLHDSAAYVAAQRQAGDGPARRTAVGAGLLPLGYLITPTPTLVAADTAYVRGNTVVRELRSAATAAWCSEDAAGENGEDDTECEEDVEEGGETEPPHDTESSYAPEPSGGTVEGFPVNTPRAEECGTSTTTSTPRSILPESSAGAPR